MNSTNREDDRYAQVSTHNNARYRDLSGWTSYVADNGVQSVDPSGFTGPTNFPAGNNPFSVAVGNFNGKQDHGSENCKYYSSHSFEALSLRLPAESRSRQSSW